MVDVFLRSDRHQRVIRVSVWVAVLGLLLGVLSSIIWATAADAHTSLKSVSPKDGATVATAPTEVVLTFDEAVSSSFATVTVTGPGGSVAKGRAAVDDAVVHQQLTGALPDGRYKVAFRVVSEDGHPVSGTSTFTVSASTPTSASPEPTATTGTPSATSTPSQTVAAPTGDSPDDGDGSDGNRTLRTGLAVGVAALALAGGTALVAASRRHRPTEDE
jgi:methionine-rich copper-binding protein CopC